MPEKVVKTKNAPPVPGVQISGTTSKDNRQKLRAMRMRIAQKLEQAYGDAGTPGIFSRAVDFDEDLFVDFYGAQNLIEPPYNISRLFEIYEESDALQSNIDAMVQNVDGFGHTFHYLGEDTKMAEEPNAKKNRVKLADFFGQVNDAEDFKAVRKKLRKDLERTGNSTVEIVRNAVGEIQMMFRLPFKNIRLTRVDRNRIEVTVPLRRNGEVVRITMRKSFRKFAQIGPDGRTLRWFKEYGDPRVMDYMTGKYLTPEDISLIKKEKKPLFIASEIKHFREDFGTSSYGVPRWIGAVLDIKGRRKAQYVNYDLFDSQGIPPMVITVSGGTLTDESVEDLESMILGMRGVENWNKVLLLESNVESVGLDDKGQAKIEIKPLGEYRAEDGMFNRYLTDTYKTIRYRFRLPDLYLGQSDGYTHATAQAAQTVAEEQVFIPEREDFDTWVNLHLVFKEFNVLDWKFCSMGPRIVGSKDTSAGVKSFADVGAFTVNHAIARANEAFGLEMSIFDQEWASYPLPIVLELAKQGRLKGIEEIAEKIDTTSSSLLTLPSNAAEKTEGTLFTSEDITIYKTLCLLQETAQKGVVA
jgi:PBSX family phage portal protein